MAADTFLARDAVAVWWMATDTIGSADLHRWLELLDEQERERSARFHFDIDRREFIAAHALLRSMLASFVNFPAPAWRFTSDADGKPRVKPHSGPRELPFNMSHTRGLVAAAIAVDGAIGIDVERIDPAKADFAMAEEYFAPAEVRTLREATPAERPMCFFRLWTLKEAYVKAIGTGLGTPLKSFAFAFEPIRIAFDAGISGQAAEDWQFAILPTTDQHVLSVAVGHHCGDPMRVIARAVVPRDI